MRHLVSCLSPEIVVEDDAGVRQYAKNVLEELGYRVVSVENAEQALLQFEADGNIDVVFTDVVLGSGLNGRQLADAITAVRPTMPVLFATGYTRNAIVHHGRLDAGVSLLNKPYTQRQLAEKLRSVLDKATGQAG